MSTGNQILFLNGSDLSGKNSGKQQTIIRVAGGTTSGDNDGTFSINSASFNTASRMKYDSSSNILFVVSDSSNLIRLVDLTSQYVYTVSDSNNNRIVFSSPAGYSSGGRYPGMDIDKVGSYLYVTDRRNIYNLTRVSGSSNIYTYVRRRYTALNTFMTSNSWPSATYIFGIAAVESQQVIYATVSFSINVLLKIPMSASRASDIVILAGDQSQVYGGLGTYPTPYLKDGFGVNALLDFPSSIAYDPTSNSLYFTECFTEFDSSYSGLNEGSMTIRKYDINSGYVSKYVGYDFSQDRDVNGFYITNGGYEDGWGGVAKFSYPLTISYASSKLGGPILYIVDYFNNAVRTVYTAIGSIPATTTNTPTFKPTGFPVPVTARPSSPTATPSFSPSTFPSFQPSWTPTTLPSLSPSRIPTVLPSFIPSKKPTFLPSYSPSNSPSFSPSCQPSFLPTLTPSSPTQIPSRLPSVFPSFSPTRSPTSPTRTPSTTPSSPPSTQPTFSPSSIPTRFPTNYKIK